jgi:2-haloalkanoic acid dehalogenase type II
MDSIIRSYDAVIFDLLTALLDSWTLWRTVAGSAESGMAWRREYLVLTYDAGPYRPYEDIIHEAAQASDIAPETADALIARWPELRAWPEAGGVLRALHEQGVALGIATNSSDALADHAVASAAADFEANPFAAIATVEAAGYYKPRPEPYRLALDMLGTGPARTLFVAGSAADVPGATGLGMPVYWHNRIGLLKTGTATPLCVERSLTPLLSLFS